MANATTVVQISDLHLDPRDPQQCQRLETVRQAVADVNPDLIVASGDLSDDGYCHEHIFSGIRAELDTFCAPVHVIPGNHDVGDKPGEKNELDRAYLKRWNDVFSHDRFCVSVPGWRILGINTQLLGFGLRQEGEQFDWLDQMLYEASGAGELVAIFLHAAPYLHEPDETLIGPSRYWGFDLSPRRELLKRIDHDQVRLVANGHVHWYHAAESNGLLRVWCPSTSFVVDDPIFQRGGNCVGFVKYRFSESQVQHQLVELDLPAKTIHFARHQVELPHGEPITLAELVLDFTGTLSKDGRLLPGVAERLIELSQRIRITVLTADTFGRAHQSLHGLPVEIRLIETGIEKSQFLAEIGEDHTVAIGNGRNDIEMVSAAVIGIVVAGPEGAYGKLLQEADVVVHNIRDGLDLVANPLRLKATLRS